MKLQGEKAYDSGHWFTLASALVSTFGKSQTYCDIGCGAGFLVSHLKNLGVEVVGIDTIGRRRSKILRISTDKQYDIVCCWNELSKLYEDEIPRALKLLYDITYYVLVVSFTISFEGAEVNDRHTIKSLNWWRDRLSEAGFKIEETITRRWVLDYKWDNIFVCIK